MAPIFIIALSIMASSMVLAHPFAVDNSTLLANGQDAQVLNAEFADLKSTDPCNNGETACIKNSFATCNGTSWETQRCPSSKQCFALPLIRGNGTFVACTSPNNAQSIISATGAKGGVVSTASSNVTVSFPIVNSTSSTDDNDDDDCSSDDDDGNDDNGQGDGTPDDSGDDSTTVTITITLPASGSVTLPTETQTFPPAEASSLISSLTAGGSFSIVTIIPASSAVSSATANTVSAATGDSRNGAVNASAPTPTTIFLTPRPKSATATPTSSSTSGEYAGY
ncbi:hypothetical protein HETIRDRAFT_481330 [Heterobasidion irregulare TC 32-1]|uniref:Carbohydrate-binding module family 19 domain-containing protein n=1 Tax=Heterobasidion irregulare (strain TC 32-1) TaxID=747525 RepID=W4JRV6_HETIT|nr:uncharacterized protein HETIRDRAFT_481330 [Heterobasidion irregulare TC 32-1]ETW75825.1 hypothetical protein HETIRDRAFT_481330 [Heterobasidion irregulare TC 32-1]